MVQPQCLLYAYYHKLFHPAYKAYLQTGTSVYRLFGFHLSFPRNSFHFI